MDNKSQAPDCAKDLTSQPGIQCSQLLASYLAGIYGAAEGISYLVVLGIVGWSLATKARTGSGLPAGPSGLLGAVEGVSFLTLLISIAVFGLQFLEKGSLPGALG